jgi:predicted MFS family arabinose efflux permease
MPLSPLIMATFLSAASARVIDPLMGILAQHFHSKISAVSGTIAAFTLGYAASQIVLGPLGDRHGKLRVLFGALIGYALAMAACAAASSLVMLIGLRAMAGAAAGGLLPVCLAYVGDWVVYERRQVTLSRLTNGYLFGQIVVGPIGGVLGQALGWRAPFICLSASGVFAAIWLNFRLYQLPDKRTEMPHGHLHGFRLLISNTGSRWLFFATLIEGALFAGSFPFVAPYMHDIFGLSYGMAGLTLSCFGLGALLYGRNAGWLVPHFGESGLVITGGLTLVAGFSLAAVSFMWPLVGVAELLLGLGYFCLHGVLQTRATELLPGARATAVSGFVLALFLGQSLGAVGMGAAVASLGYRRAFLGDAAAIGVLTLLLAGLVRRYKPGHIPPTGLPNIEDHGVQ